MLNPNQPSDSEDRRNYLQCDDSVSGNKLGPTLRVVPPLHEKSLSSSDLGN